MRPTSLSLEWNKWNRTLRPGALGMLISALAVSTISIAGCGSSPSGSSSGSGSGPIAGESTTAVIQLSSTANDEFIHFNMEINSISLTNKAGVTTTIFNTPTNVDFIPANGNAAPFATVKVPQDVYTSAAVAVSNPSFSNVSMDSQGEIYFNTDAYGYTPTPPVVTLVSPITVMGSTMGMILNLQASQSGSYTGLQPNQTAYTINPTFALSTFTIPTEPATPLDGKCFGIAGQVTAIDTATNSLTVALPGNQFMGIPILTAALNSATVFQRITSASALSVGTLVNMDIALQPDASYLATRIEVDDTTATDVVTGQLVEVDPSYSGFITTTAIQQVGTNVSVQGVGMGAPYMYAGSTEFLTSARYSDLSTLPFNANFSAASLAPGQMVSLGSETFSLHYPTTPTSITLYPQTINGTVTSAGTASGSDYAVYSVQLAPYDPIVQMNSAASAPVNTVLTNANTIDVYVGSKADLLNSTPLGAGGTFRFTGLLFNDSGVFRLVCNQVNDGVPQ